MDGTTTRVSVPWPLAVCFEAIVAPAGGVIAVSWLRDQQRSDPARGGALRATCPLNGLGSLVAPCETLPRRRVPHHLRPGKQFHFRPPPFRWPGGLDQIPGKPDFHRRPHGYFSLPMARRGGPWIQAPASSRPTRRRSTEFSNMPESIRTHSAAGSIGADDDSFVAMRRRTFFLPRLQSVLPLWLCRA